MNVILLVNDTFRRDHLGCYGNPWIKTPYLDEFSRQSAIFDQYYIGSYPTVPNRWDMLFLRLAGNLCVVRIERWHKSWVDTVCIRR